MTTIYIDVYFLINFTVDLLAIYFSAVFSKIRCSMTRILIASIIGGCYAVLFILFLESSLIMYPISVVILILIVLTVTGRISLYRKIKYAVSFVLFQLIIGGIVYFGYCNLSRVLSKETIDSIGANNKKLLVLAILILTAIGAIKIVLSLFLNVKSEVYATIELNFDGVNIKTDALIDSGNLAQDPFDRAPVMIICIKEARRLVKLPENIEDYDKLMTCLKNRVRVIPITQGNRKRILYGIKPDSAFYLKGNKREEINMTLAIDAEESDFGGYAALIPLAALEDIR